MARTASGPTVRQAAAIPWRGRRGRIEVALVTSRDGKRWVPPKGQIEPGETARQAAAREAREEGGFRGRISPRALGSFTNEKWGRPHRVEVFLLAVDEEESRWPEMSVRRRRWFTVEAAAQIVHHPDLAAMIHAMSARLRKQLAVASLAAA